MKSLIRMYSGQVYLVEESPEEVFSYADSMEPRDLGFVFVQGYTNNAPGPVRAKDLRLKLDRIESVEER